jgi:hypothetical protein
MEMKSPGANPEVARVKVPTPVVLSTVTEIALAVPLTTDDPPLTE